MEKELLAFVIKFQFMHLMEGAQFALHSQHLTQTRQFVYATLDIIKKELYAYLFQLAQQTVFSKYQVKFAVAQLVVKLYLDLHAFVEIQV